MAEQNKILGEITEISVRVVRNGLINSNTHALSNSMIDAMDSSVLGEVFETLFRDVAKAAGLPVPDPKPKGTVDLSRDLVGALEGMAVFLSEGYEKYMSSGTRVEDAYRQALTDMHCLAVGASNLNKSLQALETAMTLKEFLGEDDK